MFRVHPFIQFLVYFWRVMMLYLWQLALTLLIATPLYLIYKTIESWSKQNPITTVNAGDQSFKHKLTLNAYERIALLCERMQPANLATRLQSPDLNAHALSQAMIVAIQQEYDHNITQQVYVSDQLWNIISLAKDEALYQIFESNHQVPGESPSHVLTEYLMKHKSESKLNIALTALRTEAKKYLNA